MSTNNTTVAPPAPLPLGLLYGGMTQSEWELMKGITITALVLSLAGSIYIITETWRLYRRQRLKMSTMQYFPAFISMADILIAIPALITHIRSLVVGRVVTFSTTCQIEGFFFVWGLNCVGWWTAITAVYLWLVIVRNRRPDTGRYNWKLHVLGWVVPFVMCTFIINVGTGGYGGVGPWCTVRRVVIGTWWGSWYKMGMIFVAVIVSVFCYSWCQIVLWRSIGFRSSSRSFALNRAPSTRSKAAGASADVVAVTAISQSQSQQEGTTSTSVAPLASIEDNEETPSAAQTDPPTHRKDSKISRTNSGNLVAQATSRLAATNTNGETRIHVSQVDPAVNHLRKLATHMNFFILIYIIEWTPCVVYTFFSIYSTVPYWSTVVVMFLLSSAGFFNAIIYSVLLGRARRSENTSSSDPVSTNTTTSDSSEASSNRWTKPITGWSRATLLKKHSKSESRPEAEVVDIQ